MQWLEVWKRDYNYMVRIDCMTQLVKIEYWRCRALICEGILKICFRKKNRRRAEHIWHLEQKVEKQSREIRLIQLHLEQKNREHKALNILVACDGPCNRAYMDDPSSVDEEVVQLAERNAKRLRHWWNRGGQKAAEEYKKKWNK